MRNLRQKSIYLFADSKLHVISALLSACVVGCGGNQAANEVEFEFSSPSRAKAFAQKSERIDNELLYTFNYFREDSITGWDSIRRVATALDRAKIEFNLVDCGVYGADPILGESGGYIWAPIGVLVKVSAGDVDKAEALGGVLGIPAGTYIRQPQHCGNTKEALSPVRRLFAWASSQYPMLFPGFTEAIYDWNGFSYTYFEQTGNYIGVRDGKVSIHNGRDWIYLEVGKIGDFIPTAIATSTSQQQ